MAAFLSSGEGIQYLGRLKTVRNERNEALEIPLLFILKSKMPPYALPLKAVVKLQE